MFKIKKVTHSRNCDVYHHMEINEKGEDKLKKMKHSMFQTTICNVLKKLPQFVNGLSYIDILQKLYIFNDNHTFINKQNCI
jgi:hypothetical protein